MAIQLPLALGGAKSFQPTDLEVIMAHLGAGGANSMESNGIGYEVGEPGLLVADTADPTVQIGRAHV